MEVGSWHSYPSIFALGHRALAELFSDPVQIEEKIDGSQFSFGLINGELRVRSKGKEMPIDAPEKMFSQAVETVKAISDKLQPGWTYRAEYLQKPKHNALAYDRVPQQHLIIFDINTGHESYMRHCDKAGEARRLGLETVPLLFLGEVNSPDSIRELLDCTSILGGQKIEGVVIKNYKRFGPDKKVLMGKFVSEAFKEIHDGEWRKNNPTSGDVVDDLIKSLRTPARWDKAIQHLAESGQLENSPRDIGKIMLEIPADVLKECRDEIVERLFAFAWPKVRRGLTAGFPDYYKQKLLDRQFSSDT